MGYSYSEKEFARLNAMQKKESRLLEMYIDGYSFNGKYIFLVSDNKMPKWNVTDVKYWELDRSWSIEFKSFKSAYEFCLTHNENITPQN